MPELNLFNGGINTLKDPRKLELNEGFDIADADIVSGSVISLPREHYIEDNVAPVFLEYRGHTVSSNGDHMSFTKMHDFLFKSDGVAPRYSLGARRAETDYSLDWYEMGIDKPAEVIDISLLSYTNGEAFFEYNYPTLDGAMEASTTYRYMIERIENSKTVYYTIDITSSSSAQEAVVDVNFMSISNITNVYRKIGGYYFPLTNGNLASTQLIQDFELVAGGTLKYGKGRKKLYALVSYADVTWNGNGTANLAPWTGQYGSIKLNFETGSYSAATVADGSATEVHVNRVKDDPRVPGLKEFDVVWWLGLFDAGDTNNFYRFTIRYDGYDVTYKHPLARSTPSVYNLALTSANGVGDNVDLTSKYQNDLKGSFEYAITYENTTGEETPIGPISSLLTSDGQAINVAIPVLQEPNADTHLFNLYRRNTGLYSGGTSFLLVDTFTITDTQPSGITYIDNKTISELGRLMPARTLTTVPDDILYFTEHKGRLFGATKAYTYKSDTYLPSAGNEYPAQPYVYKDVYMVGDIASPYTYTTGDLKGLTVSRGDQIIFRDLGWSLYDESTNDYDSYFTLMWSNAGEPNSWDSLNYLNHSYNITGLCSTSNGLIVYSSHRTYVLFNTNNEVFNFRKVSGSQGCIDYKSIQEWQGSAICASAEGISITDGGSMKLISYPKLGLIDLVDHILSSAIVGEDYFLLLDTSLILRMNMLDNTFTYITADEYKGIEHIDGRLYAVKDDTRYEIGFKSVDPLPGVIVTDEDNRTFVYRTGKVSDGSTTNLKEYDKVRINHDGTGYATIYIDDEIVIARASLTDRVTTIGIPNELNKGYSITFEVGGVGKLHGIEYSVRGRDNG